jgi:hypothetical protein
MANQEPTAEDFVTKTRAMTRSREYQEHCWQLYRRYNAKIKELIKWRIMFNLQFNSNEDMAIGYIIFRLSVKHKLQWKRKFEEIMVRAEQLSNGLWKTFIQTIVNELRKEHLAEQVAGTSQSPYTADALPQYTASNQRYLDYVRQKYKAGVVLDLVGPPPKEMPDWYFIASSENEFYHQEQLEAVIQPLIAAEEHADNQKIQLLNQLNHLLEKHAWKSFYEQKVKSLLTNLRKGVEAELKLRQRIQHEGNIQKVHQLNTQLKQNLDTQETEFSHIVRELHDTNIADPGIHSQVDQLLQRIAQIIRRELTS